MEADRKRNTYPPLKEVVCESDDVAGDANKYISMSPKKMIRAMDDLDQNLLIHRINQLRHLATDGPLSYRALALTGGCAMSVISGMYAYHEIRSKEFIEALFSIHLIVFGIVIFILEFPTTFEWKVSYSAGRTLKEYVSFLHWLWGRGAFYVFAGSLQAASEQFSATAVGCGVFVLTIGLFSFIVGRSTARKLRRLHEAIADDTVMLRAFEQSSAKNNLLTPNKFRLFLRLIGLELGASEFRIAFNEIDHDQDGKISYKDFRRWWDGFYMDPTQLLHP